MAECMQGVWLVDSGKSGVKVFFAGPTLIYMIWGRNRYHWVVGREKKGVGCSAAPGTLEQREVDRWLCFNVLNTRHSPSRGSRSCDPLAVLGCEGVRVKSNTEFQTTAACPAQLLLLEVKGVISCGNALQYDRGL